MVVIILLVALLPATNQSWATDNEKNKEVQKGGLSQNKGRRAHTPSRSQKMRDVTESIKTHVLKIGKVFDAVIDFKLLSFYDNLSCTLNRN